MKLRDDADDAAEKLFNMVRDEKPDQEVTDAIAEALRTAGPIWTFGVPAEEGLYLVWDGDDVFAAHWLNGVYGIFSGFHWEDGEGYQLVEITHWMPLPARPKGCT